MRRSRMLAVTGVVALATTALGATTATAVAQSTTTTSAASAASTSSGSYVVLAKKGADVTALARSLERSGAKVTSVNTAIGLVTVTAKDGGFLTKARGLSGVQAAARDGVVGRSPMAVPDKNSVEKPRSADPGGSHGMSAAAKKGKKGAVDPLDSYLWGMDMIDASEAHRVEMGDKRVRVGVMDTGVDGSHPDLAANFDDRLSRNFTTDMGDIDGATCEFEGCVDPADHDDNGHGTHVAGTMAAAMNGLGVSGVAPEVGIVNVRAGQDSGYFFLTPTVNALTYSGDVGLDVVNMSFYVDPWAYNCIGGAPEDSPEEAAEQGVIIEAMTRALNYAHERDVTLVGALGNGHDDLANPRTDTSSPDYPAGAAHPRTIDNATCFDLPVEGPHVIGVSAVGPTERKAYYSNWTTDLSSGEIEVAAPGGDYYDSPGGTPTTSPSNLILSTAPLNVLQEAGDVDADGNITDQAEGWVMKDCRSVPGRGEECGYYQYLQGTSMAAPHASGVAALIVSAHGKVEGKHGFTLDADTTAKLLMDSARDKACPAGSPTPYDYPGPIPASYNASCVGTADFNGFYGDGIVNAYNAVK